MHSHALQKIKCTPCPNTDTSSGVLGTLIVNKLVYMVHFKCLMYLYTLSVLAYTMDTSNFKVWKQSAYTIIWIEKLLTCFITDRRMSL